MKPRRMPALWLTTVSLLAAGAVAAVTFAPMGAASALTVVVAGPGTAASPSPASPSPASTSPASPSPASPSSSYNGLALTPPMGFNNWAGFECNSRMNQQLFTNTADSMVSLGLDRLGYQYVNIDDCWMQKGRDTAGNLQVDATRFPSGMKWLGNYIHAKGLKFGTYEDAGYKTCQGAAGSYGHFDQDARLYASWGVDYLKLDYCYPPLDAFPGMSQAKVAQVVYTEASQALLRTGRPFVFSESAPAYVCCSGSDFRQELTWLADEGNLWRFGSDIADDWASVIQNYTEGNTTGLPEKGGPGHWNDADMLEIGNGGLSLIEAQSQFTLWSEMASPLLLSTDLSALSPAQLAVIRNEDVIAVDQDALGRQGKIIDKGNGYDVLSRPLADGDYAVVLFNKADTAQTISTTARTAGLSASTAYELRDLVTKTRTETTGNISANVPAHGTVIYRVSPTSPGSLAPSTVLTLTPGGLTTTALPTTLSATLRNNGSTPIAAASIAIEVPAGWTVTPAGAAVGMVAPGAVATAQFPVVAPPPPPGKVTQIIEGTAGYSWNGQALSTTGQGSVVTNTPFDNLPAAFNNIGITSEANPALGNFDGSGNSYDAEALAKDANVHPGDSVDFSGAHFTWPNAAAGIKDNVSGGGLQVKLSGQGSKLGFLGAEAGFVADSVTVTYTDGSASTGTLGFPNWCCTDRTAYGAQVAFYALNRNTASGPANFGTHYQVFYNSISIDPSKTVAMVTLPNASQIHVFDMVVQP